MIYSSFSKALVPALLFTQNTLAQGSCAKKDDVTLTFFGLGSAGVYTKFKCDGTSVNEKSRTASVGPDAPRVKSGVGSYEDPALFATASSNPAFSQCDIIYIPYFKKYFQYGDICAQCESDWQSSKLTKIDLWIGPNPAEGASDATVGGDASCQMAGGTLPGSAVIQNPPKDLEVQSEPLQGDNGSCWKSNPSSLSFPNNEATCSGGGGGNTNTDKGNSNIDKGKSNTDKGNFNTDKGSTTPAKVDVPKEDPPLVENLKQATVEEPKEGDSSEAPVKKAEKQTSTTTTTSSSSSTDADGPTAPVVHQQKVKVVPTEEKDTKPTKEDNTKDSKASKDTTPPKDTTPSPEASTETSEQNKTTTTGKAGDPCPENGWFDGCVWASGPGQLGDSCKAKTDCWSNWICVAGKCADNTKRLRRGLGHSRRHLGRRGGVRAAGVSY